MERALRQPDLRNGMAVFNTGNDTVATAHASIIAHARLLLDRPIAAASLTKPLVAHQVALLVDSGQLQLDDNVPVFLPDWATSPQAGKQLTLRRLLQHTSGLGHIQPDPLFFRDGNPRMYPDCEAAAHQVLTQPLAAPGKIQYANANYCLLGEILLRRSLLGNATALPPSIRVAIDSSLGGAGGWNGSLHELHRLLVDTLPLTPLRRPETTLPDGSWYNYGWRWRPRPATGAPWTHYGRLPGIVTVALSDGHGRVLVAYFDGDPVDYEATAQAFSEQAWPCLG